ncbi:TerD family protein [Nocardia thailandica]|uniref:TerD family protein n=1 Tax=Nocardia thailandica TaxID=257275 RepID=UPI000694EAE8|nr:exonuclease domain-containing protein [Nocardia thailandica]
MLVQRNSVDPGAAGFGAYTVVDVETSGVSAERDRVLSVAALTLDAAGRVTGEFHTLLDPGCDPGPVHIHGLTREILRGAPQFGAIRDRLAELLDGRVLVAHNARFDYGFLAGEFGRTGAALPVRERLCTLALARRVAPPARDRTLGGLAAYYGVPQTKAHDALDDTRVLAGVLRALVADAARLGITPPVLTCDPADIARERSAPAGRWPAGRRTPKPGCPYAWPGRYVPGDGLIQGMKVVITGDTATERPELIGRAEDAGLDVTGTVSRRTSLLVTNDPASGSAKARAAREYATPVLSEPEFLRLLPGIREGKPADGPTAAIPSRARPPRPAAATADPASARGGPLHGRRVLVLGADHARAAAARARVTALGGAPAVNLSARVTDVLVLPGGGTDRRVARARALGLPVHGPDLLGEDAGPAADTAGTASRARDGSDSTATAGSGSGVITGDVDGGRDAVGSTAPVPPGHAPAADVAVAEDPRAAPCARARAVPPGGQAAAAGFGPPIADGPGQRSCESGGDARGPSVTGIPGTDPVRADAAGAPPGGAAGLATTARELSRGQVVDLPGAGEERFWAVRAAWSDTVTVAVDLVAFAVGADEKVRHSDDFVFYNQPATAGARLCADGPGEQTIDLALDDLPAGCRRVVIAAALDGPGTTFGEVGAVELEVAPGPEAAPVLRATLDAATAERTLILCEMYLRGQTWRLRAVGQGYETGLAELARRYGVAVDGEGA